MSHTYVHIIINYLLKYYRPRDFNTPKMGEEWNEKRPTLGGFDDGDERVEEK